MPIGHGEGCFYADETTLDDLEANHQVLLRYVDAETGEATSRPIPTARNETSPEFAIGNATFSD